MGVYKALYTNNSGEPLRWRRKYEANTFRFDRVAKNLKPPHTLKTADSLIPTLLKNTRHKPNNHPLG